MAEDFERLLTIRAPTAERPLLGLTVLVVEDSRFASEAMRLLCLRSGARIRRADSLGSARRHLAAYRPAIVIIDIGLPDGSGLDLIRELAEANGNTGLIFGMSGESGMEEKSRQAGAIGFIEKPIESLSVFQRLILGHLPENEQPKGLRLVRDDDVHPDELALLDDLARVSDILTSTSEIDPDSLSYAISFLRGLARIAHDEPLDEVTETLAQHHKHGQSIEDDVEQFGDLVQERLAQRKVV